ncbi:MAG: tRNA (5-methylaminomethyl-2-thiouridine)(34)-methyltransferase MnmD [Hyphomicrobiales bacterium]|nr:tRNA (5-methylaminomethyl-2-thiouridine)(34)-methyltransferase MnmD [Hyphomicrobiales bacterium]MCP4997694.1 tRNA (5-methylaminomethyl-2-thiouridine)(34)-methyltransferase MnmD [Hyphomicrobiales bacterium]
MNRNKDDSASYDIEWHEGDMPYSRVFGDHFYSRADGRAECNHVFLNGNGLPARWQENSHFTIAELGFGTGLNFCETWRQWRAHRPDEGRLLFVSFEKYPMCSQEIGRALAAWPELTEFSGPLIEHRSGHTSGFVRIDFNDHTALEMHIGDALSCLAQWKDSADAWFLDGFAPARNPDMWSEELMGAVFAHTVPGGSFATYTAAGWVRRNLEAAGFSVNKQEGYAGKRDMTVGSKVS